MSALRIDEYSIETSFSKSRAICLNECNIPRLVVLLHNASAGIQASLVYVYADS